MDSRVLCLVTTRMKALKTKTKAINDTWGRRCDKVLYVISEAGSEEISGPDVLKLDVPEGREHLTAKSMKAFKYVHDTYMYNYSWFLKGDDDTYVIIENLKRLLSINDYTSPIMMGHYFKMFPKGGYGYHSGGAAYVMSQKALHNMIKYGVSLKNVCREDGGYEDVEVHACLLKTGSRPHRSIDRFGRETFHPAAYRHHIVGPKWDFADAYSRHKPQVGPECCSELLISFHWMTPELIYLFDHLLYKTTVYGRRMDVSKLDSILTDDPETKLLESNLGTSYD